MFISTRCETLLHHVRKQETLEQMQLVSQKQLGCPTTENSWDAPPLKTVGMLYEEPDQLQIDISGAKPNRPRCVIFRLYLVLCFSWYSEAQSELNDMKGWLWVWLSIVEKPQRAPIWWSEAGGPIIWELTCGRRKVVLCEYCGYCKIGTILLGYCMRW